MPATGPASTRLRTVTLRGGRTTLRLEEAAWSALDQLCALRGEPRRTYLQETFDAAAAAGADNRAAFLRARIMTELSLRLARAGDEADRRERGVAVAAVLRVCPAPAFVIDSSGRLDAYNDEMAAYARKAFPRPLNANDTLSMRFARPLRLIESDVDSVPGAPVTAAFTLTLGRQAATGRARLIRIDEHDPSRRRLLGCIQP